MRYCCFGRVIGLVSLIITSELSYWLVYAWFVDLKCMVYLLQVWLVAWKRSFRLL